MAESILDLADLTVTPLEAVPTGQGLTLEQIAVGHLLTETGASAVGQSIFVCSCCCCC